MFGCVDTKLLAPSVGPLITAVHRQITAIISISVTVAMYCLLQMYFCVAEELAPHRPILKLFAVKAVGMFLHICVSFRTEPSLLDSIFDLMASHFSISTQCGRCGQRHMAPCFPGSGIPH